MTAACKVEEVGILLSGAVCIFLQPLLRQIWTLIKKKKKKKKYHKFITKPRVCGCPWMMLSKPSIVTAFLY